MNRHQRELTSLLVLSLTIALFGMLVTVTEDRGGHSYAAWGLFGVLPLMIVMTLAAVALFHGQGLFSPLGSFGGFLTTVVLVAQVWSGLSLTIAALGHWVGGYNEWVDDWGEPAASLLIHGGLYLLHGIWGITLPLGSQVPQSTTRFVWAVSGTMIHLGAFSALVVMDSSEIWWGTFATPFALLPCIALMFIEFPYAREQVNST